MATLKDVREAFISTAKTLELFGAGAEYANTFVDFRNRLQAIILADHGLEAGEPAEKCPPMSTQLSPEAEEVFQEFMAWRDKPPKAKGSIGLSDLDHIERGERHRAVTVDVEKALVAQALALQDGLYPKGQAVQSKRLHDLEASVAEKMEQFSCAGSYQSKELFAWDAIEQSMLQSLDNDDNFLSAMTSALFLAEQAKDQETVQQWLSNPSFVIGAKQILRNLYKLRTKLEANEAQEKRGLAVAGILIEVFENLVRSAET